MYKRQVLYLYIFFYLGVGALFFVFLYLTPMEVVPPVGMLVYTAVYTLAADGAVFDTPKKSMVRGTPKWKPTAAVLCSRDT